MKSLRHRGLVFRSGHIFSWKIHLESLDEFWSFICHLIHSIVKDARAKNFYDWTLTSSHPDGLLELDYQVFGEFL